MMRRYAKAATKRALLALAPHKRAQAVCRKGVGLASSRSRRSLEARCLNGVVRCSFRVQESNEACPACCRGKCNARKRSRREEKWFEKFRKASETGVIKDHCVGEKDDTERLWMLMLLRRKRQGPHLCDQSKACKTACASRTARKQMDEKGATSGPRNCTPARNGAAHFRNSSYRPARGA